MLLTFVTTIAPPQRPATPCLAKPAFFEHITTRCATNHVPYGYLACLPMHAPNSTQHVAPLTCRGNTPLQDVHLSSTQLGLLVDCSPPQGSELAVNASLSCTGVYIAQQDDVEAGALELQVQGSSPTLLPPQSITASVDVTVRCNPSMLLDVVGPECTVNLKGGWVLHKCAVSMLVSAAAPLLMKATQQAVLG